MSAIATTTDMCFNRRRRRAGYVYLRQDTGDIMDSILDQLKRLSEEGSTFAFDNFSNRSPGDSYGGEDTSKWLAWKIRVTNLVSATVEDGAPPISLVRSANEIHTAGNARDKFERQKSLFLSALLETARIVENDVFGEARKPKTTPPSGALSNRVFVVHGHDHATKTELESFLTYVGIEPVVLHRQPDQGRTLIEKFEHHSDVGYAFILLTPDDVAYSAAENDLTDEERSKELRARQNVIFEFGFFVGKLGRTRVCCLIKGHVAKPSDINGLVYKPIPDSIEGIGFSIIKELRAAGYTVKV
jgi:predicted nucleotide-binding protein